MRKKNIPDRLMNDLVANLRRADHSPLRIMDDKTPIASVPISFVREFSAQREKLVFQTSFKRANISSFSLAAAE